MNICNQSTSVKLSYNVDEEMKCKETDVYHKH